MDRWAHDNGRADLIGDPLAGLAFQDAIEARAYTLGGGDYVAPAQRVTDLVKNRRSGPTEAVPTPRGRERLARRRLSASVFGALQQALPTFDRQVAGYFTDEAIVVATESRSSSPVRIERDRSTCESPSHPGLFPCGEGAGQAGGMRAQDLTGSGSRGDLSATWRLFMINLVTLCARHRRPRRRRSTRSAGGRRGARRRCRCGLLHGPCSGRALLRLALGRHPRDKPFQEDTVPTTAIYAWSGALTAASALEGGEQRSDQRRPHLQPDRSCNRGCSSTQRGAQDRTTTTACAVRERGDRALLRDAKLSFPSGHSSTAFALALHTGRWLHRAGCRRGWSRPAIASGYLVPMALAAGTGWTRVTDHRHNLSDVVAGAVIGLSVSYGINRWHFGSTQACQEP